MKLSLIITVIVLLVFVGFYLLYKSTFLGDKKYNWTLELTKPLDYEISVKDVFYYKSDKEIHRYTSMNSFSGWSGSEVGNVLHNKVTDYLPDSVKVSWIETNTGITYASEFVFPKQKIVDYWNENIEMLKEKWGNDYPDDQISLKLGLAPDGIVTLWLYDYDINTSGFALEVESYRAASDEVTKEVQDDVSLFSIASNKRYGTPHFYTFEGENVVAISVRYHNGESNTISVKNKNGSILERINKKRGWSLVKRIIVHWFEKDGKGYKSTYEIELNEIPIKYLSGKYGDTDFVYLLDRQNSLDGDWNNLKDKHVFELTETQRKAIN